MHNYNYKIKRTYTYVSNKPRLSNSSASCANLNEIANKAGERKGKTNSNWKGKPRKNWEFASV